MKTLKITFRIMAAVAVAMLLFAFSCNKDEDDDNNNQNNGGMWDPGWLIGTWEATTPSSVNPWPGTKIRIVFESYTLIEHDTLPNGVRKAYAYNGTFTWDVDGNAPWSQQFFAANYPVPDFNVILWDCMLTASTTTMNNLSFRIGDEQQTDPFHVINLDCGPIVDGTGNAPDAIDLFGDIEIETGGNFEEAIYPPNQGTMIRLTKK